MITLGSRIKKCREAADLYQSDVANRLNVTSGCISSWEHDRTEPNVGQIKEMANLFNVSANYLVTGLDVPVSSSSESDSVSVLEIIEALPSLDERALTQINNLTAYLLEFYKKSNK